MNAKEHANAGCENEDESWDESLKRREMVVWRSYSIGHVLAWP